MNDDEEEACNCSPGGRQTRVMLPDAATGGDVCTGCGVVVRSASVLTADFDYMAHASAPAGARPPQLVAEILRALGRGIPEVALRTASELAARLRDATGGRPGGGAAGAAVAVVSLALRRHMASRDEVELAAALRGASDDPRHALTPRQVRRAVADAEGALWAELAPEMLASRGTADDLVGRVADGAAALLGEAAWPQGARGRVRAAARALVENARTSGSLQGRMPATAAAAAVYVAASGALRGGGAGLLRATAEAAGVSSATVRAASRSLRRD